MNLAAFTESCFSTRYISGKTLTLLKFYFSTSKIRIRIKNIFFHTVFSSGESFFRRKLCAFTAHYIKVMIHRKPLCSENLWIEVTIFFCLLSSWKNAFYAFFFHAKISNSTGKKKKVCNEVLCVKGILPSHKARGHGLNNDYSSKVYPILQKDVCHNPALV